MSKVAIPFDIRKEVDTRRIAAENIKRMSSSSEIQLQIHSKSIKPSQHLAISKSEKNVSHPQAPKSVIIFSDDESENDHIDVEAPTVKTLASNPKSVSNAKNRPSSTSTMRISKVTNRVSELASASVVINKRPATATAKVTQPQNSAAVEKNTSISNLEKDNHLVVTNGTQKLDTKSLSSCNSRENDIIIATMLSESNSALAHHTTNPSELHKNLKESGAARPNISFSHVLHLNQTGKADDGGSHPGSPVRRIIEDTTNSPSPFKYFVDSPRSRTQSHGFRRPTSPTSRSQSPSRPGSARSKRSFRKADSKIIQYVEVPMSDSDKLALRLGKILMGSLFIEPDLKDGDMLNKFFLDKFLSVYGSSTGATDSFNIDLICEVQNAMVQARLEWPDSVHGSISSKESEQDSHFAALAQYPSEYQQDDTRQPKAIAAIALEALDVIIKEYGRVNPLFQIIKGAIQPMIFSAPVGESENPSTEHDTLPDDQRQLSKYLEQSTWYEECQAANATIRQLEYKIEFEIQRLMIETKKSESMNKEYDLEVDTRVLAYKSKCEDMLHENTSLKKVNDGLIDSNKKLKDSLRESNAETKKFKNLFETENQSRIKFGKKVDTLDYDLRETKQSNKDMKRKINDLEKHNQSLFSCLEDAHSDARKMKDEAKATREKFSEALIEKMNTIRDLNNQVVMAKEFFDSSISSMQSTVINVFGKNSETAKHKISAESSLELFSKLIEVPAESEVIIPEQGEYIKGWQEMMTLETQELLATRTVMRAELRRVKDSLKQADERCEHKIQEAMLVMKDEIAQSKKNHEIQLKILLDEIEGKNNEIKQLMSDQLALIESSSGDGPSNDKVLQDSSGNALSNIQEVIKELKRCQERIHKYEDRLGMQREDMLLLETRNRLVGYKRDNNYLAKETTALRQELEAINDKFLESKRRNVEKENRIKIEQDREKMNTTMNLENLQEEIIKLTAENKRASDKIASLDAQMSVLRGNIAAVTHNLGKSEGTVAEKNRALQISEICLMEIEDRLSKDALNTVKKRGGKHTRRSSLLRSSFMPVFYDTDYKEVEIGLRSDKKWEVMQERIQVEKLKVATLSAEFREEANLITQDLRNFEKIFGVVSQLLVSQVMVSKVNHPSAPMQSSSGATLVSGQLQMPQQLQSRAEKQAEDQAKIQEKLHLSAKLFSNLGNSSHSKPNNTGTQTVITEFPEYDEKFRADEKFAKFLKVSGTPKELSQPFLGYIRKNEKILAREVGFMRVLTREFKGVYDATRYNLKKMILALPPQTDSKLLRAVSKGIVLIKKSLDESSWMFEPQQFDKRVKTSERDPVDVFTQNRIIKSYEEELHNAAASAHSVQVQSALGDLLEDLRNQAERSGGWAAALYLENGSVDFDMDETPWSIKEQLEIARIKLKYSQYVHDQKEMDYTAIIERLKALASKVASSAVASPGSPSLHSNKAGSIGSESEPLEFMHSIINVAMAKERMSSGVGLMSAHESIANLTKDGSVDDYLEHDILAMKEATVKIQRLEAAIVEATAVLLPILDQIDDRLDDHNFRKNVKRSEQEFEFSLTDTVDGDDFSDVSEEDIVDKIMRNAVRDIGKEYIKGNGDKALTKEERIRRNEVVHHHRREAFLERDKLLNQLEKKSKNSQQNLQKEREFVPRPCSSMGSRRAELQPHLPQPLDAAGRSNGAGPTPKRAISAGISRDTKRKLLPLPLQQEQTGNKSFVDNNTHEGWRQFESQMRHERAKAIQDDGAEPVSPLSPIVVPLRPGDKKEVSFADQQDAEVLVEKLLSICTGLKERSNPRKSIRGSGLTDKPRMERSPDSLNLLRPRTSQPSIDTATIQDRKVFRDAIYEDYRKCINEASRLKGLLTNLDATIGKVAEGKAEEKNMLSVHKDGVKNHYNSKLLLPSRLSNNGNAIGKDLITMTDTMFSGSTVTSIHDGENGSAIEKHIKISLPHLRDPKAGRK